MPWTQEAIGLNPVSPTIHALVDQRVDRSVLNREAPGFFPHLIQTCPSPPCRDPPTSPRPIRFPKESSLGRPRRVCGDSRPLSGRSGSPPSRKTSLQMPQGQTQQTLPWQTLPWQAPLRVGCSRHGSLPDPGLSKVCAGQHPTSMDSMHSRRSVRQLSSYCGWSPVRIC